MWSPISPVGLTWSGRTTPSISWTGPGASQTTWTGDGALATQWGGLEAVSVASRLNRAYPQIDGADGGVDFAYRVQTEYPWFVATNNHVVVASALTEALP